jgi:soluble lytic murein transglycosylase-like protein
MNDSNLTGVRCSRFDWSQAVTDLRSGLSCVVRWSIDAVGVATVIAGAILIALPAARDQLAAIVPASWANRAELSIIELPAPEAATSWRDVLRAGGNTELHPRDALVAQYLARRYHVADDAVRLLVAAAHKAGTEQQVDPLLILSVMAVESSMNPFAQSPVGAQGLMQVMTSVHGDKFEIPASDLGALDPVANIRVGSAILGDAIRRGGSVERGLQLYVGAGNLPDDAGYAARVMAELGRLKLAASGAVDAALASSLRADAKPSAGDAGSPGDRAPARPLPVSRAEPSEVGRADIA